jgi:hypothetical protein
VRIFDPARPRVIRALLTLRYAKRLNAKTPDTVPQATLDAAVKHLCASGVPYLRARAAYIRGGNTAEEAAALLDACYPTLPIVAPPPP